MTSIHNKCLTLMGQEAKPGTRISATAQEQKAYKSSTRACKSSTRANKLSTKRLRNEQLAAQGNNSARKEDQLPVSVQRKHSYSEEQKDAWADNVAQTNPCHMRSRTKVISAESPGWNRACHGSSRNQCCCVEARSSRKHAGEVAAPALHH
jgi:hypothetical protein